MTAHQYNELIDKIKNNIDRKSKFADECSEHLKLSLIFLKNYMNETDKGNCSELVNGAYGAAVESVSLISFSLVRPAILSLRSYYELSLQFLYYKDHPIEWRNSKSMRVQPTLPSANKKYLKENFPKFENRLKTLLKVKKRFKEDCYDVLSGVAHGTAINSISSATKPEDLIESDIVTSQAVKVFYETSECLSDIYISAFEGNWLSVPELTKEKLIERFDTKNPTKELDF